MQSLSSNQRGDENKNKKFYTGLGLRKCERSQGFAALSPD
jgi:hypothetical protein